MSKPNIDKTLPPEADLTDAADFQAPTPGEPTTALELKNYAPVQELTRIQKERGLPDADFARTIRFDYSGSVWGKIKAGTFNGSLPKAVLATKRALAFAITGRAIEAEHGTVMFDHVTATVDAVELARHSTDGGPAGVASSFAAHSMAVWCKDSGMIGQSARWTS